MGKQRNNFYLGAAIEKREGEGALRSRTEKQKTGKWRGTEEEGAAWRHREEELRKREGEELGFSTSHISI